MHPRSLPAATLHFATALLATALLAGCSGDNQGDGLTMTTEALPGGATLVRHTPSTSGVPATWHLEEELRIGAMDGGGPAQFGRVAGLAVAGDGRIVVLDEQAQEVRVFSADGTYLRTLGGRGGGPGEMQGANDVVFGPDGLLRVPDVRGSRLSFFDPDRGFLRSHPYTPLFLTWPWDSVVDDEGSLWSLHWIPGTGPEERGRVAYVGYDTAGTPLDTFPTSYRMSDPSEDHPGRWNVWRGDQPMASLLVPFYPQQRHLLDHRLRVWSTAEGDPTYRLTRQSLAGDTSLILETDRPPRPVDRAVADSIAAAWEERLDARLDRSKVPETAPAIQDYFVDEAGRLWVHARTPDDDSLRTFDVYDGDGGAYLGTLATPIPLQTEPRPVIRGGTLWGVVRDELDVPYIIRARLATPAHAPVGFSP